MFLRKHGTAAAFATAGWILVAAFVLSPKFAVSNAIVIGSGICVLGIALLVERIAVARRAIVTEGTVLNSVEVFVNRYTIKHAPTVTFVDRRGSNIEFNDLAALRTSPYTAGEKLTVLYDPKDPVHAYAGRRGRLYAGPIGLMVTGALVFGIGLYWYPKLVFG